ncbi:MAG TPA: TlpA disulfide reductase family protein [Candidatus Limnocylindria bacterium]|jgi:thiol-disulfide isomerase/thioredoxin|nr:TlpA disulfide reductase family protein [Candidatus Limnocylindria bacterium]
MSRAVASKSAPSADRRKTILYATIAVVVVAIVVGIGLASRNAVPKAASEAPIQASIKVGQTAPAFSIQTNAGPFDLNSVSTPVLLEVFASWCPHCQRETQVLNSLATTYAGKLAIVAVTGSAQGMDGSSPESQADVNQFGATFQIRYPLAFDPDMKVAQQYLQGGYPTLVLINKSKKIAMIKDGEVTQSDLTKAINAVL